MSPIVLGSIFSILIVYLLIGFCIAVLSLASTNELYLCSGSWKNSFKVVAFMIVWLPMFIFFAFPGNHTDFFRLEVPCTT